MSVPKPGKRPHLKPLEESPLLLLLKRLRAFLSKPGNMDLCRFEEGWQEYQEYVARRGWNCRQLSVTCQRGAASQRGRTFYLGSRPCQTPLPSDLRRLMLHSLLWELRPPEPRLARPCGPFSSLRCERPAERGAGGPYRSSSGEQCSLSDGIEEQNSLISVLSFFFPSRILQP